MIVDTVNRSVTPRSRSMGGCGECLGKRGEPAATRKRRNKMSSDGGRREDLELGSGTTNEGISCVG